MAEKSPEELIAIGQRKIFNTTLNKHQLLMLVLALVINCALYTFFDGRQSDYYVLASLGNSVIIVAIAFGYAQIVGRRQRAKLPAGHSLSLKTFWIAYVVIGIVVTAYYVNPRTFLQDVHNRYVRNCFDDQIDNLKKNKLQPTAQQKAEFTKQCQEWAVLYVKEVDYCRHTSQLLIDCVKERFTTSLTNHIQDNLNSKWKP